MKWQCSKHRTWLYAAPGRCIMCHQMLQPVQPVIPKVLRSLAADPKMLNTSLEIAGFLLKRLFR